MWPADIDELSRLRDLCGPWSQGPVVPEALNILEGFDLAALGHNSPDSLHVIAEALKLAFSDRHSFIGDPRFVDVPIEGLLSKSFASERRSLISMEKAWPDMPPPGDPSKYLKGTLNPSGVPTFPLKFPEEPDTSYICVVDRAGNAFSATPSDAPSTPIIPELGFIVSSRGYQAWIDPDHPSSIAPGKRPRLTPSPGMVMKDGRLFMAFGTPGNDRQPQAMVQFLANVIDFKLALQEAVEAPRLASFSFPATGHPHRYVPGLLRLEDAFPSIVTADLAARGHIVENVADVGFEGTGSICAIQVDQKNGFLIAAADNRRMAYALGR